MWWIAAAMAADVVASGDRLQAPPVAFVSRSAALTPESAAVLDGVAALMAARPELVVRIEVHTDAQGSDTYNLRMSQDRADAVRAALVERGVSAERLVAQGWGETKPIGDNATVEGRAGNRRVEWWTNPTTEAPPAPPPPASVAPVTVTAPPARVGLGASPDAWCGSLASALELVVTKPQAVAIVGGQCTASGAVVSCAWPGGAEQALSDALIACLPSGSPVIDVSVTGDASRAVLLLRPR